MFVFICFSLLSICIHLCHVYLQLHLMPLRNRSYWPLGHVSDPGDGAREDLRGPAPGGGYMVSLCLKSLPQGEEIHIDNHCYFFLLGGSILTIHLPQRRHQTMFYLPNRKGCVRYIQVVKKKQMVLRCITVSTCITISSMI